jgi:type II secretory pathway pseudopilin PulG
VRPKSTSQAKARAKARKAKAPKVIRTPLRERVLARLAKIDLSPRTLLAKIPFVVLVIGALAVGLGVTLWLSTDSAQRSYQLSNARTLNAALSQQKEALERDVLEAQSAPALADAARNLGMIPSRDTAHLVKDPAGNWVVIGAPKPATGAPPPPLNFKLPDETPTAGPNLAPGAPQPASPAAAVEVPVLLPPPNPVSVHLGAGATVPGPPPLPGPALLPVAPATPPGPAADTLATAPVPAVAAPVPTVAAVPPVTDVAVGAPLPGAPN